VSLFLNLFHILTSNPAGTHALYTESVYSFDTHSATVGTYVLNINDGRSFLLSDSPKTKNYVWIGANSKVVWQAHAGDTLEIWVGDALTPGDR
jgi:pre-mRNA-splicing helicase BRR2